MILFRETIVVVTACLYLCKCMYVPDNITLNLREMLHSTALCIVLTIKIYIRKKTYILFDNHFYKMLICGSNLEHVNMKVYFPGIQMI